MCFHFRHSWPLRMWTSSSLQRSGNAWTLLRGPCTRMWWWRPTGTCCLWVRMTSLWSWNLVWGYLCIFPLCFLAAPVLLDWVYSLVDSEIKKLHDWHQDYKLVLSSGALPTVWYTRSFSTAWAFVKLISNFEIPNFLFLPLCSWFSSSWEEIQYLLVCVVCHCGHIWLFGTQWTVPLQAVCSWNSPGKNTGVGCPGPVQRDLPHAGIVCIFLYIIRLTVN